MNVTYLIGAGASAQAIPTVKDFNTRFLLFIYLLQDSNPTTRANEFYEIVKADIPTHYSVDTYARKLLFQDAGKYNAYKTLLSFYFLFEQMRDSEKLLLNIKLNNREDILKQLLVKKDPRYDAFFAALINKDTRRLTDKISVISWNYDLQFELSFAEFLGVAMQDAFKGLSTYPGVSSGDAALFASKAKFIKLNGLAGLYYDKNNSNSQHSSYKFWIDPRASFDKTALVECNEFIESSLINSNSIHDSLLSFSWDNALEINHARERAKQIIKDTDSLIIIGYSFPNYNRTVDKEVLSTFNPNGLKKICLQVSNQDFDMCKSGFEACLPENSWNLSINQVPYLNLFYIDNFLL